ncbi:hypothetical protein PBCVKS1B_190R [Paramecium bursaria Chlorella virus KS1B]|nr:hypothetical protein PBCVKS1B_190R [Paramecium bursaria Chlorella virus KS1B]
MSLAIKNICNEFNNVVFEHPKQKPWNTIGYFPASCKDMKNFSFTIDFILEPAEILMLSAGIKKITRDGDDIIFHLAIHTANPEDYTFPITMRDEAADVDPDIFNTLVKYAMMSCIENEIPISDMLERPYIVFDKVVEMNPEPNMYVMREFYDQYRASIEHSIY